MRIKVEDSEYIPTRASSGDAGYDLRSKESFYVYPFCCKKVPLGVSFEIPRGYYGVLTHRSSLAFKKGTILSLGIIDSSFTGEVHALLFNLSIKRLHIKKGDRIAQMVFHRYHTFDFELVEELEDGKEGFGSSGIN